MKVEVTDKFSGAKMAIDPDKVLLLEPDRSGVGSHIVLDPMMGRVVVEEYADLKPYFDVVSMSAAGLKAIAKKR